MNVGLFPGQGVDGRFVVEALPERDELLEAAGDILGLDVRARISTAMRRARPSLSTRIAQPAIFIGSVIAGRRARERMDFLLGHSLGEYAALVIGGALGGTDGLKVVCARAEAMHAATRQSSGGMVAILGLGRDEVERIADRCKVGVANDNAPGQIVVSGFESGLAEASSLARAAGGRAVRLAVAGAFHTTAVASAAPPLRDALDAVEIRTPGVPVISNVTARPHGTPDEIRSLLVEQLTAPVRFREALEWLWGRGVRRYLDLGPGRVAEGLARRTFESIATKAAHV
jgi:[acyl-carrier-protein] S-malonyltransferase